MLGNIMTKINFKNNKTKTVTTIIASIVIGLMMLSSIAVLPNVTAQQNTVSSSQQSYGIKPVLMNQNGTLAPLSTQPYVAAFHDVSPHFGVYSAKFTCNFSGTDRNQIQS